MDKAAVPLISLAKAGLVVMLLITSWYSARMGTGALFNMLAKQEIQAGSVGTSEGYRRASSYLHTALHNDSSNPGIQLNLARIQLYDPRRKLPENQIAALAYYRRAVALQPQESLIWAEIFAIKSKLREFDEESDSAIANAIALGGWEPKIQYLIVDAGTASWLLLTPKIRRMVIDMAARGLVNASGWRRSQIRHVLGERQFHNLVCIELINRGERSHLCPE